jgi:hypothetical protein
MRFDMAYETKPMSGSVFKNDSGRGKSAWSGTIKMDNNKEYWIDLYENISSKTGNTYFGITIKEKGQRPAITTHDEVPVKNISQAVDDEVPF